jgi:excisionase family DNA binding protein
MTTDKQMLLTASQIAERLQVSLSFVYELIQRGELKSVHMGRAVRVRPEDLHQFIEQRVQ